MNAVAGSGKARDRPVFWQMTTRRIGNAIRRGAYRLRDTIYPSLTAYPPTGDLQRLIPAGLSLPITEADRLAVDLFLQHRFDLLGSGWISASNGAVFGNHTNPANRITVRRVRQAITPGYKPIEWHVDHKSGYRWSERTWYRAIRYPSNSGVDIKIPWELSRLHHLVDMGCVYSATHSPSLAVEFRDQTLDWIASNPPRFGVNWACTMDVGIRIANLLLAYDLFCAAGAEFEVAFRDRLVDSTIAHAQHIADNLEWSEKVRSNHYLANVCGLFIAAAYLPEGRTSNAWLAFAAQELINEAERQFLPDGGHFEASVCYHGLCTEMLSVCAAIADCLPMKRLAGVFSADPSAMRRKPGLRQETGGRLADNYARSGKLLGEAFYTTISRAARFTRDVTKPDGTIAQIGDNDGGRFLRTCGWIVLGTVSDCRKRYASLAGFRALPDDALIPATTPVVYAPWLAWANAVTEASGATSIAPDSVAATLARALARPFTRPLKDESAKLCFVPRTNVTPPKAPADAVRHERGSVWGQGEADLREGGWWVSYADFGVYIYRSSRVHLVFRCGWALHDGKGVHAHEDQLSFELTVDGRSITRDPGTFLYEPSRKIRNAYRCAAAHVGPSTRRFDHGKDPSCDRGVFLPPRHGHGIVLDLQSHSITGRATVDGGIVTRTISISTSGIEVRDYYLLSPSWEPASAEIFAPTRSVRFSPTYGWQES